jgi:hypothetical protein
LAARALVEGLALAHPRPFEFAETLGLPGRIIVVIIGMGMVFSLAATAICRSLERWRGERANHEQETEENPCRHLPPLFLGFVEGSDGSRNHDAGPAG